MEKQNVFFYFFLLIIIIIIIILFFLTFIVLKENNIAVIEAEEFDPEAHDKLMENLFDDNFYNEEVDGEEDLEKPVFEDDDDEAEELLKRIGYKGMLNYFFSERSLFFLIF